MTQPVGRVLDAPPELRFWLRSSPFICAADILCFVFRIITDYVLQPEWSWRHVRTELAYRFRDEDWADSRGREIERAMLGRWMLMLLGGIPCQTIKLVAMRGIPLTQTAGLLFFLAQVFGEVITIAAEWMFRSPGGTVSVQLPPPSRMRWTTLWLGEKVITLCHVWHAAICAWVVIAIPWHRQIIDPIDGVLIRQRVQSPVFWPFTNPAWMLMATFLLTCIIAPPCHSFHCPRYGPRHFVLELYVCIFPPGCMAAVLAAWDEASLYSSQYSILMIVGVSLAIPIITVVAWTTAPNVPRWLSKTRVGRLFGIPQAPSEQELLGMFMVCYSVTIASYAYIYLGGGTVNPVWLGVFG
jgi:hypothetical protein